MAASLEELDAFPSITGGNDVLPTVAAQLSLSDLARSLCVCKSWQSILDGTPQLWRALCEKTWAGKVYVPGSLCTMASRDFPSDDDAKQDEERQRQSLLGLKIAELKHMMYRLRVEVRAADLIEKGDFVEAILDAKRKVAAGCNATENLLCRPWKLVRPKESLPKAALRLALADAARLRITKDELTSLVFCVRLRNDGPLAQAMCFDPWWQGQGYGEARFSNDGLVRFTWPPDLDDPAAEPMDPFAAMGMRIDSLGWELIFEGCVVQLMMDGHGGPQEFVCRHPLTWGWILYSGGTCWTSWPMPACVEVEGEKVCSDPLLREPVLYKLPSDCKM